MPNGHGDKKYGPHKYAEGGGTSNCEYDCGCWMGPARSGGPAGLNPFGKCPKNPVDGKLLGGKEDYTYVVEERISDLTSRVNAAETRLKRVSPTKKRLADELLTAQHDRDKLQVILNNIHCLVEEHTP